MLQRYGDASNSHASVVNVEDEDVFDGEGEDLGQGVGWGWG